MNCNIISLFAQTTYEALILLQKEIKHYAKKQGKS
jgi:hypothetical protein